MDKLSIEHPNVCVTTVQAVFATKCCPANKFYVQVSFLKLDIGKDELLDAAKENHVVSVVGRQLLLPFIIDYMTLIKDNNLERAIPLYE